MESIKLITYRIKKILDPMLFNKIVMFERTVFFDTTYN